MGKTFVVGDLHNTLDIHKISEKRWGVQHKLDKDDVLIQLGDFGALWSAGDLDLLDWFGSRNYTFAFVDGNHENFDMIEKYPIIEKWGGKVREINTSSASIFQLLRGETYHINGKSFLALGGAHSIDKAGRIEGVSWWAQELWTAEEKMNAVSATKEFKFDYVVAHTCPTNIAAQILARQDMSDTINLYQNKIYCPVSAFFDKLTVVTKEWHFGHWHVDMELASDTIKYFCHYDAAPRELV